MHIGFKIFIEQTHCLDLDLNDKRLGVNSDGNFSSYLIGKGQLISKANCQAEDSSKKRTNEFIFNSMRRVFVRFLEESLARKKCFEMI